MVLWQVLLLLPLVLLLLLELPACLKKLELLLELLGEPRVAAFLQQALQHRAISED